MQGQGKQAKQKDVELGTQAISHLQQSSFYGRSKGG
jgi:hypothetical protein